MKLSIPVQLKAVLVMIAIFSFVISYNNLHAMAIQMGIPYYLAWFFPLCIDLFLIACSIFILYAEEKQITESREGWFFLITYTILSIWYNVLHSPPEFWYQVGFAICPISLCVSLHLFIKVIKHEMEEPKNELKNEPKKEIVEVVNVEPCNTIEPEIVNVEHEQTIVEEKKYELTEQQKKVLDVFKSESDISMAEAGRRLDMSYKTVKKYKDQLIEMGML